MSKKVNDEVKKILDSEISKSKKMISLYFDFEMEVKEISELMGVRYNFVYNVVNNYCLINGIEKREVKKEYKKDKIIEMLKSGVSKNDICKELRLSYNRVWSVEKEIKILKSK